MIATISNRGKLCFRIYEDNTNADLQTDFMKRQTKTCYQNIFLVLDSFQAHHTYKFRGRLSDHMHEIEVFYLPQYSPGVRP
ncbi:transposase [Ectothiorhodospira marina]|uniref:transposase n=1 Tax=Ectothiorhodospira marina TaxID=1396821 RepID=UPI0015A66516